MATTSAAIIQLVFVKIAVLELPDISVADRNWPDCLSFHIQSIPESNGRMIFSITQQALREINHMIALPYVQFCRDPLGVYVQHVIWAEER